MPTLPTGQLTQEQHYFRNKLNIEFDWDYFEKLNTRLPQNLKWRELEWNQSLLHKFGAWENRKCVSACEHFEVVYTSENMW